MKILHALICFFLSLLNGTTARVHAEISVFTRFKGGDIPVNKCPSSSSGSCKIFCKETCDRGNILIQTTENRAHRDRYSVTYEEGSGGRLSVGIKQLTKSDSGLYRCGLGNSSSLASFMEFEIIVIDALLNRPHDPSAAKPLSAASGADLTVACFFTSPGRSYFFCKDECKDEDVLAETGVVVRETRGRFGILHVSITQLSKTDSGRYRCGLDRSFSSESHRDFHIIVSDAAPTPKPDLTLQPFSTPVPGNPKSPTPPQSGTNRTTEQPQREVLSGGNPLCGGLSLVVVVVLTSLAVLIVRIKRKSKPSGLSGRRDSDNTNVEFPVYENQLPVFTSDESMYQSLDPANRDHNQIYPTLTQKQQYT